MVIAIASYVLVQGVKKAQTLTFFVKSIQVALNASHPNSPLQIQKKVHRDSQSDPCVPGCWSLRWPTFVILSYWAKQVQSSENNSSTQTTWKAQKLFPILFLWRHRIKNKTNFVGSEPSKGSVSMSFPPNAKILTQHVRSRVPLQPAQKGIIPGVNALHRCLWVCTNSSNPHIFIFI